MVFNYADKATPSKIKEMTHGRLKYAVDCISEKGTWEHVAACFEEGGGQVAIVLPYKEEMENIKKGYVLSFYILGKVMLAIVIAQTHG